MRLFFILPGKTTTQYG